jgi:hypothetical protein
VRVDGGGERGESTIGEEREGRKMEKNVDATIRKTKA